MTFWEKARLKAVGAKLVICKGTAFWRKCRNLEK